ncbi:M10 family metallopeptidase, partial [Gymnodinialimonas hymeniacidonis]|uniref:M10 family metallopeptidase n=1 Tax=Gymnodinialimonas hymeniacidonis TaxID=3126508 RepID=UPI0034C5B6DA
MLQPSFDGCPYSSNDSSFVTPVGIYTGDDPLITETGDAAGDTTTAYELGSGGYFHGTLSNSSDVDVIALDVTSGVEYSFAVVGIGGLDAQLEDPILTIKDADGNILFSNDDVVAGKYRYSHITETFGLFGDDDTGTVYLEISGWNGATGGYGLSVVEDSVPSYDIHMGAGALVRTGLSWAANPETPTTVTWAFRETQGTNSPGIPAGGENPESFQQFTAIQQAAFLEIIALAEGVSGLTLNQVTDGGDNFSDSAEILIAAYNTSDNSGGYAWLPSGPSFPEGGDIWINEAGGSSDTSVPIGSYSYYTLLHELGHALGLSHPALYNAGSGGFISYDGSAIWQEDSVQFTVMSYFDESFTGASGPGGLPARYPDTFMLMDILALQSLYGADLGYNSENTTYGYNATHANTAYDFTFNRDPFLTIWDGAGVDTIDVSAYGGAQKVSLEDGTFSDVLGYTGTLAIAIGAVIENAIGGAGDDTIMGNSVANSLEGGAGADSIVGGDGADSLRGGSGNDTLLGGLADDFIFGDDGDDVVRGGAGDDQLYGLAGDDTLDVGEGTGGWQYAYGHEGNDTYLYQKAAGLLFINSIQEGAGDGAADRLVFDDLLLSDLSFASFDYGGEI